MAIFNVTTGGSVNLPPTQVGDITIDLTFNETYVFTIADFTTLTTPVYSDPEGDSVQSVKILTLPAVGGLLLSAVAVTVGQEIALADITGGNLTYVADVAQTAGYTDSAMTFNIADDGSGSYGAITPGVVTFTAEAEVNLPPSSIGNLTINLVYGEFHVFTRANFTTETTPAYVDPEGDPALNLKILSLPATGNLKLSAVNCTVNQVVPFSSIDSGLFTYAPNVAITTVQNLTFDFAIADSGSLQYSS
jgi:hypothetical protein